MARFSKKRAAIEREYKKVWRSIAAESEGYCKGCGRTDRRITPSHRIDRKWAPHLIASRENISEHCISCQELCETGQYEKLFDGEDIKEYILSVDPEYYRIKTNK